ncbi:MAG: hypothetical protein ACREFW_04305, partial [Rhizomicrobium sp.]
MIALGGPRRQRRVAGPGSADRAKAVAGWVADGRGMIFARAQMTVQHWAQGIRRHRLPDGRRGAGCAWG